MAFSGRLILGRKEPFQIGCGYANRLCGFGGAFLDKNGKPQLDSDPASPRRKRCSTSHHTLSQLRWRPAIEQGLPAFLSGKAAMMEFWTDLGVNAQDPKVSQVVDKWDVTQIPVGGANKQHRASLNAGFGLGDFGRLKNPDAAWELVKFGCSAPINLAQMIDSWHWDRSGVQIDARERGVQEGCAESAGCGAAGVERRARVAKRRSSGQDAAGLADQLALILDKSKTPEKAMKDTQAMWVELLGG